MRVEDQERAESSIGDGVEGAGGEGSDGQGDETNADESIIISMCRVETIMYIMPGSRSHEPLERPVVATVRRRGVRNRSRVVDCNCETMSISILHADGRML